MAAHKNSRYGNPRYGQAEYIIRKFGGESSLARLLGISRVQVYRWTYRRPVGTDGLIPLRWRSTIETQARLQGILLLPRDWEASMIRRDEGLPEVFHASTGKSLQELLG